MHGKRKIGHRMILWRACGAGLKKAYRVSTMTAEILQASVDKSSFPISLVAETTAFARCAKLEGSVSIVYVACMAMWEFFVAGLARALH